MIADSIFVQTVFFEDNTFTNPFAGYFFCLQLHISEEKACG
jgi:hypothetical protein